MGGQWGDSGGARKVENRVTNNLTLKSGGGQEMSGSQNSGLSTYLNHKAEHSHTEVIRYKEEQRCYRWAISLLTAFYF